MSCRRRKGLRYEDRARDYLASRGLSLLAQNFRRRGGEIDLVMRDAERICFVEVKYRRNNSHGSGADAVTFHKQNRISLTAAWYLAMNPGRAEQFCRFDVISIDPEKGEKGINWIKSAFYSTTQ